MSEKQTRTSTGFLFKQRAFLKMYMITLTEQNVRLYGTRILGLLRKEFAPYGYKPQHTEIYKALHDLIDDGILEQVKQKKEGMKHQVVVYYRFANPEGKRKGQLYKQRMKHELERSEALIRHAIKDNFGPVTKKKYFVD